MWGIFAFLTQLPIAAVVGEKNARAVKVDARLNKGFEVGAVCRAQLGGVQGDVVHGGLHGGVQ